MEDDDFRMLNIHGLTTKTLQVSALRIVRLATVQSYESVNNEEKRIRSLFSRNGNNRGSHNLQETTYNYHPQQPNG